MAFGDINLILMIDLSTVLLFVATEATKGALSEGGKAIWESLRATFRKLRGSELDPASLDASVGSALLESSPTLAGEAKAYATDSLVLRRADSMIGAVRGTRILWIDDHPEWNLLERRSFESLGMSVLQVETTRSALACLEQERFDIVLSDISRGEDLSAGLTALPMLTRVSTAPVIFYVGSVTDGVPRGAFGLTAKPDDLLHLCLDAISRVRI